MWSKEFKVVGPVVVVVTKKEMDLRDPELAPLVLPGSRVGPESPFFEEHREMKEGRETRGMRMKGIRPLIQERRILTLLMETLALIRILLPFLPLRESSCVDRTLY